MILFNQLYQNLDRTNKTNRKVEALIEYFKKAPPADAAWGLWILIGGKASRILSGTELREVTHEVTSFPLWMIEECYETVGDLAETCALLTSDLQQRGFAEGFMPLHAVIEELLTLRAANPEERRRAISAHWRRLPHEQKLLWNKLLTGSLRVGVSRNLVVRALSQVAKVPEPEMAHRMMGYAAPSAKTFEEILKGSEGSRNVATPYPFFLAYPLQDSLESLGAPHEWQAEWKWDGIRCQLMKRASTVMLWSRGEEAVTEQFPEIISSAQKLSFDAVLDGEILAWKGEQVQPFSRLQRRLGRKKLSSSILIENPVIFLSYDILEFAGEDLRQKPLYERRNLLQSLIQEAEAERIRLSPIIEFMNWEELAHARDFARAKYVEGLMLKEKSSAYGVGRRRGPWWKWKIDPLTVDAVLMYAQGGSGRRAGLYTDLTFGVWDRDVLVPIAKAYSGLTDQEFAQLNAFIRANTLEKFGPVRSLKPELVFELGFEGIQESRRHRSGVALRFPRMLRWRRDKPASEADTIERLKELL